MLRSNEFVAGLRRSASSVCVVTTTQDGAPSGITVTSFVAVSVSPPTLLVCIHEASRSGGAIRAAGRFCVNLLADTAVGTAELFAGRSGVPVDERFAHVRWHEGDDGCPVLADALIAFECRVEEASLVATHWLFVARVHHAHSRGGRPLIYADRAFRALAASDAR